MTLKAILSFIIISSKFVDSLSLCLHGLQTKAVASFGAAAFTLLTNDQQAAELNAYYGANDIMVVSQNQAPPLAPAAVATAAVGTAAFLSYRGPVTGATNENRSYVFDSVVDKLAPPDEIPEYLLAGLMAGLYILPAEEMLKTQSDASRRMKYKSYRKIEPDWQEFGSIGGMNPSPFKYQAYAEIPRLTYVGENQVLPSTFRCYKFELKDAASLNAALTTSIIADAERCLGIAVSNAGGYHSTKDYFSSKDDSAVVSLSACADEATRVAESDDNAQSQAKAAAQGARAGTSVGDNRLRTMGEVSTYEESWVNINKDGHWNRMHTHIGSTWSGVYYVQSNTASLARPYSGSLLLKPTSHVTELAPLDPVQLARLGCAADATAVVLDPSICDYVAIKAEPGMMVLFPSWLRHAVTPLSVKPSFQSSDDGLRISMAFNALEI